MKGLFNLVCGVQPVRVVYGDGEVLYLPPYTTVEEVLQSYPHHFVCQPGLSSDSGGRSNQMLSLDAELQSGCIYFLLPVPRLFPAAPSPPSQCRCYASNASTAPADEESVQQPSSDTRTVPCRSPLRVYSSPQRIGGLGSPFRSPRGRSLRQMLKGSKSKVLPESNLYSAGRMEAAAAPRPLWRNCPWRPRLGCISEEDDLELALEELRYYGFMRRRESAGPAKTFAKPPPPQLKPSKSARIMADAEIEWNSATAGVPTMIAIC
ncbi:hypothetical protein M758_1G013400 [Ceratodon purpureus]|uniref:Uncharacterized protein n=1 Tax=Ceratodon purpureus TaxID=3225 RepID=A0A8T0J2I1_CERPU|nr:hypothetical protein KC19_1G014300 [Ceratodon purpureus]KAG0628258.1 hypothetical protein M758_1G013400 [Ceratodon purpureus]